MGKVIRVLNLEDSPADAELIARELQKIFPDCNILQVETRGEYLAALDSFKPHIILSDYNLPKFNGMSALKLTLEHAANIPFIIVTGSINEDIAVECMKAGAWDYIIKESIQRLEPAVSGALKKKRLVDKALQAQIEHEKLMAAIEAAQDIVIITDPEGIIEYTNSAFEIITGYSKKEAIGHNPRFLKSGKHGKKFYSELWSTISSGHTWTGQMKNRRKDGTIYTEKATISPVCDSSNQIVNYVAVKHDITKEIELEKQSRRSDKMEAIGYLAGGIAHDFNNILTAILGNVFMAKKMLSDNHQGFKFLEESEQAANRAKDLTSQLLTFAKGGAPITKGVSLGKLVYDIAHFDLSGSSTKLVFKQSKNLWPAEVDKGQMQQVFSNLTINAKQAMPNGGTLYITLENANVAKNSILGLSKGKYIKITVRDEGSGINPAIMDQIFNPYFTTKPDGNGLGLATVYSIINKHEGNINIRSEPGKGTTFTLYLPAAKKRQLPKIKQPAAVKHSKNEEASRILVMDDEEVICNLLRKMLNNWGFLVEIATDGKAALDMYKKSQDDKVPFDLVIMDLTIPGGMGGKEAAAEILKINPAAKCIVSSGYANDPVMANYRAYGFKDIVVKPYTPDELWNVLEKHL